MSTVINVYPTPVQVVTLQGVTPNLHVSPLVTDSSVASTDCQPCIYHQSPPLDVNVQTSVDPYVEKFINGYDNLLTNLLLSYSVNTHVTLVRWKMYTIDLADRILDMVVDLKSRP